MRIYILMQILSFGVPHINLSNNDRWLDILVKNARNFKVTTYRGSSINACVKIRPESILKFDKIPIISTLMYIFSQHL